MRRANKHFDQVVVQAIVELTLERPLELRMVEIARVQIEVVGVNRDIRILELDDHFNGFPFPTGIEIEQRMLVKTQLGEDAI